ncbi:hypothetical protein D3OALGA1CA_4052 [Olavius algarvensis associated proteobacterium Delta 3]|nr:hypothetical protein D3OALGB2SA_966 [Olavius algarvensis associated proteobacterium Delta 3]CAB5144402.1 hypothetical protein D3OALGA1CA_4052 [Olavius algarvensis associated proteobacterium Delta 3]
MSIRLIAIELYRCQQEVDHLEKELAHTPVLKKDPVRERLRKARAARDRMRYMLDGQKDAAK